ncbi:hypothetical protein [Acidicapsa acidisoli]|uniref:hypothetical protein n=1 Tax=Acidicapsa acidisoli TaxID=1615681 RepID=UPI0021E05F1A|nr:hypothetical protein [Acidicapsa acidisoli]
MTIKQRFLSVSALIFAVVSSAAAQTLPLHPVDISSRPVVTPQPLFDFHESEIKFSLQNLMDTLRDRRHEGWVLTAYPDPKTSRPLIGAGFSLDIEAVDHPQRDPLNPHPFLEPSSAQLWQAAGLEPTRLQQILDQYDRDRTKWTAKRYRRKILARTIKPEVTEEEATSLLRISAIQAIYNARAYCRGFDQMTASQQMALSQMVFQMGVNMEEFVLFLDTLNADSARSHSAITDQPADSSNPDHWKTVQHTLIDSQWATLYTGRASIVIAMFDPDYPADPAGARQRVAVSLRPAVVHRRRRSTAGPLRAASYNKHVARKPHKGARNVPARRKIG